MVDREIVGERAGELLTYVVIALLHWGPLVAYLLLLGPRALAGEPSLVFWLGAAALLWIGTALSVMAWGAAAVHWRSSALRVDQHVRGFFAAGGDALQTVNVTFLLFGFVVLVSVSFFVVLDGGERWLRRRG